MLKYNFKIDKENNSDLFIDIPIKQIFYPNIEQIDPMTDKLGVKELNIINQIIDFEKVRVSPTTTGDTSNNITSLKLKLHFIINNKWTIDATELTDIGFDSADVENRSQQLEKTFLRLSFYDSNNIKTQNLLYYSTIFIDSSDLFRKYIDSGSKINGLKTEFKIENPKTSNELKSFEGFYIYLFADDIPKNNPKTIYMKVEFNNALNGKTSLFAINTKIDGFALMELKDNIFIPIQVEHNKKTNKYVYWFDKYNSQNIIIDLYQVKIK